MEHGTGGAASVNAWLAAGFQALAAAAMWLILRTEVVQESSQRGLFLITAVLLTLAVPGPVVPQVGLPCQVVLWYAIGWSSGIVLFGIGANGALPMLPLILVGFGLTFWPAGREGRFPWQAAAIGVISGMIACGMLWGFDLPLLRRRL